MKKLKKLLLVGLCSFIFCVSASALEYQNFNYYTSNNGVSTYLNLTDEEKETLINNLESIYNFDNNDYEYYIRILEPRGYVDNVYLYTLTQYSSNNKFFIVPKESKNNSNDKQLTVFQNSVSGLTHQSIYYSCKNPYELCEYTSNTVVNNGTYLKISLGSSSNYSDIYRFIYDTNQEDFEYLSPPNLGQSGYDFSSSNNSIDSFSIDNQTTFYINENISSEDLIGNYYPFSSNTEENTCDRTGVLGSVSNVSEIKLNVKGETSALAEPLKGTFTLNFSDFFTVDDFSVEFINNSEVGVVGNYTFKCATDSNNCYLNYEYNTEDDITETANFSFKINLTNNRIISFAKIFACTMNNNYSYISYDYTNGPSDSTTSNPSLDNYLNDLTPPSSDISGLGNIQGILPEGPVDGLLNIPFKVISILIDGFNGTCKPISFNFVFDMPLTFPCVGDELYNHMDSTLLLFVNIVPTAFILIKWFKNLYVRVQRATSLETTTDDEWGGI